MNDPITTTTTDTRDPADIERDIRRTQDNMSRTVDKIGDQLTPRSILNALLDKAESNDVDARKLIDGARRNPLALAMIAGGAIWLVSDNDAKLPSFGSDSAKDTHPDPSHRDYIDHMQAVEWRDSEDEATYLRRRDIARANFLIIERRHDEDEGSYRKRLDDATQAFNEKRQALADSAREAGASIRTTGRDAAQKTRQLYSGNPLIGGLAAATAGAILGTAVPLTRTEDEQLAGFGESARDMAREEKDKLVAKAEKGTKGSGDSVKQSSTVPEPAMGS